MRVEAEPTQPVSGGGGQQQPAGSKRTLLRWLVPLVAVVAVVVLAIVLLSGGDDDSPAARRAPAGAASLDRIASAAADAGHPVYWAGPQAGMTYELTTTKDGRIFIRYLPRGVSVGDEAAKYLTVATYPQRDAFATLTATAKKQGVTAVPTPGGGRAFEDGDRATSAYVAFPGADVQVEVFDPVPGRALRLARSGEIAAVDANAAGKAAATAATAAELEALPSELGRPVYWAGAEANTTYELTRTSDGRVFVRYLPEGVAVGTSAPDYLTVGTYPVRDALATVRRAAADSGSETFDVGGGGVAYVDAARHPKSVFVAFPDVDAQIEVYAPGSEDARELLSSGRIAPVR